MSNLLQSGHHPDADQLNAFIEHALPRYEYEQMLAHLSVCPDCRAVVALSMPPSVEAGDPQAETVRKPWFSGWKLVWPAAAAVAALAVVVVHIRNTKASHETAMSMTERADSHPPAQVPAPEMRPIPASKQALPPSSKAEPDSLFARGPASSSSGAKSRSAPNFSNRSLDLEPPAPSASRAATTSIDGKPSSSFTGGAVEVSNDAPLSLNPSATPSVPLHQNLFNAGNAAAVARAGSPIAAPAPIGGPLTKSQVIAPASPANNAPKLSGLNQDVAVTSVAPEVTSSSVHGASFNQAGGVLIQPSLPSRLPAISMVSAGHQTLAIDAQNTLFFSGDNGKSWKAITPQWQGRAVKVRLATSALVVRQGYGIMGGATTSTSFDPNTGPVRDRLQIAGSTLAGKVTDATGAAIPAADVVVTNTETAKARTVKTDHSGSYVIDDLVPGQYKVAARAPGFQEQVSAVSVTTLEHGPANFILPIGQASETVAVEATPVPPIPLAGSSVTNKKVAGSSTVGAMLPLFEITTENGDHWTSPDGQTWKHK
jgi:hypothetical protein